MFGFRDLFMEEYGVPVLEPGAIAAKMAETLVDLGLKQSKRAFPTPESEIILKAKTAACAPSTEATPASPCAFVRPRSKAKNDRATVVITTFI